MKRGRWLGITLGALLIPTVFASTAAAHCPLCSAGAGGAAGLASALGVGLEIVGVFIGAFALATGALTMKYIDKQYIPHQMVIGTGLVYLSIVVPVVPFFTEYTTVHLSLTGEYGSLLNRTYLVNRYALGALLGGAVTALTPFVSRVISTARGRTIPYQGVILTFGLLVASALLLTQLV